MNFQQETVFRREIEETRETFIRADLFNGCRSVLAESESDCCFIPVRSLQYQAIISAREIIFVDSLYYAVRNGKGGRLIMIAWDISHSIARESLNRPVPITVNFYLPDLEESQLRLMSEFPKALDTYRNQHESGRERSVVVLPFEAPTIEKG